MLFLLDRLDRPIDFCVQADDPAHAALLKRAAAVAFAAFCDALDREVAA